MTTNRKKIVIIGATSAIAEQCARIWVAASPIDLILVGRDIEKTEQVACDLRVRSPQSSVNVIGANFVDPTMISELVVRICEKDSVDIALIAHGTLPDQTQCQQVLEQGHLAMSINGISPVLFAEAFASHMQQVGSGTIAIIGSVAGDRGRRSNYVYGAAKGMVTRYAQGLQHRFAGSGIQITLIKPGPTDTPMTAHLKQQGAKLAAPEAVARRIVDGIRDGQATIYAPGKWAIIMMIIRHMPNFIFNKLNI